MFKSYIESVIRSYLNSPSLESPPAMDIRQHSLFNGVYNHLSVRKITNGFLMAYNDGSEVIYCANEKDLADQIIARAARSKVHGEQNKTPQSGSQYGVGINAGINAPVPLSYLYNTLTAGKL